MELSYKQILIIRRLRSPQWSLKKIRKSSKYCVEHLNGNQYIIFEISPFLINGILSLNEVTGKYQLTDLGKTINID